MANWCKNIGELDDFIAFVVLYGPDRFPAVRNMDMEKAFQEIAAGIENSSSEINDVDKLQKLRSLSDEAEALYSSGADVQGAHKLQKLAEVLTTYE